MEAEQRERVPAVENGGVGQRVAVELGGRLARQLSRLGLVVGAREVVFVLVQPERARERVLGREAASQPREAVEQHVELHLTALWAPRFAAAEAIESGGRDPGEDVRRLRRVLAVALAP